MSWLHDAELADTLEAVNGSARRPLEPPPAAVSGQVKIADVTYRRVRAACLFAASYVDLDEHCAQIALAVHRARAAHVKTTAHRRSVLDGQSAAVGEGGGF